MGRVLKKHNKEKVFNDTKGKGRSSRSDQSHRLSPQSLLPQFHRCPFLESSWESHPWTHSLWWEMSGGHTGEIKWLEFSWNASPGQHTIKTMSISKLIIPAIQCKSYEIYFGEAFNCGFTFFVDYMPWEGHIENRMHFFKQRAVGISCHGQAAGQDYWGSLRPGMTQCWTLSGHWTTWWVWMNGLLHVRHFGDPRSVVPIATTTPQQLPQSIE